MFALPGYWILFGVLMPLGKSNTSCPKLAQDLQAGTNTNRLKDNVARSRQKQEIYNTQG